jgi:hypothetical protein
MVDAIGEPTSPAGASADALVALRREPRDIEALAARGCGHERLDQLVTELLLGVR